MIVGIVNQAVIGIDDPLRIPGSAAVVDIALVVLSSLLFRKMAFIVGKTVAADTAARTDLAKIAFLGIPAFLLCLCLRDEIGWELSICEEIQRDIVFCGILSVLGDLSLFDRIFDDIAMEAMLVEIEQTKPQKDDENELKQFLHSFIIKKMIEKKKGIQENARMTLR